MPTDHIPQFLAHSYAANPQPLSTLFMGPSGIGKSAAVREAAKRIAKIHDRIFVPYDDNWAPAIFEAREKHFLFVDMRLVGVEPADIQGIPREVLVQDGIMNPKTVVPDPATPHAYSQIYDAFAWADCLARAPGILFLDELSNVQRPDVFAVAYQLTLDHLAGFTRFHPKVMIVAAGNDTEESSVANELPAPLINRFTVVRVNEPSLGSWRDWMHQEMPRWDLRVLAYLANSRSDFLKEPENVATFENYPTPRQWTVVASSLHQFDATEREAFLVGRLGQMVGLKFLTFLNAEIPPLHDLIQAPDRFTKLSIDGKYLATMLLTDWLESRLGFEGGLSAFELNSRRNEWESVLRPIAPLCLTMANDGEEYVVLAIHSLRPETRATAALGLTRAEPRLEPIFKEITQVHIEVNPA